MKFGPVRVEKAEGAMLAHATTAGDRRFRKAHRLTADDIAFLKSAGVDEIVAAVLSDDDLDEDAAAARIAGAMRFRGIEAKPAATGRVNLHALEAGVFTVDRSLVDRLEFGDGRQGVAAARMEAAGAARLERAHRRGHPSKRAPGARPLHGDRR